MKKILVLFPKEWDRLEFERPEYRDRYEFVYAGFDLFSFPSNAQLATFASATSGWTGYSATTSTSAR